jgi:hypothetical protein
VFKRKNDEIDPSVTITDYEAAAKYLIDTRNPALRAELLTLANRDIAAGRVPPGVTVTEVLNPDYPAPDLDLGNSEK